MIPFVFFLLILLLLLLLLTIFVGWISILFVCTIDPVGTW